MKNKFNQFFTRVSSFWDKMPYPGSPQTSPPHPELTPGSPAELTSPVLLHQIWTQWYSEYERWPFFETPMVYHERQKASLQNLLALLNTPTRWLSQSRSKEVSAVKRSCSPHDSVAVRPARFTGVACGQRASGPNAGLGGTQGGQPLAPGAREPSS